MLLLPTAINVPLNQIGFLSSERLALEWKAMVLGGSQSEPLKQELPGFI